LNEVKKNAKFQEKKYSDGVYVGEMRGDIRDGYGKFSWNSTAKSISYEGFYKNDKREGFGIYTWTDGARYEGKWSKDNKHGSGVYYFNDGRIFEG
jgi:hypothetical protein